MSIDLFGERLRSQQYTLHQLRKMLEAMPRNERFEALFRVWIDPDRDRQTYFGAQHVAGRLLLALRPRCTRPLEEILISIAPTWNPDVSALPFYLCHAFGRERVIAATAQLEPQFPPGSREHNSITTIEWWLTGAVTFFPNEGTRQLSVEVELERAIGKKARPMSSTAACKAGRNAAARKHGNWVARAIRRVLAIFR